MTTEREQPPSLSPLRAIREHCHECMPEPRGAYLRCDTVDCPLWRHRAGSPARYGRDRRSRIVLAQESVQVLPRKSSALDHARLLILETDSEAKATGKGHFTPTDYWPFGYLGYRPGERALKAVARMCRDCCGTPDVAGTCCSPNCALAPYRFGRRPRLGDVAPVPNVPGYLKGTSRE